MVQSSEKIAQKLLQIIFNTKEFVESKCSDDNNDIASKLKNLILSNNINILNSNKEASTNSSKTKKKSDKNEKILDLNAQKFNILINYYLLVCDLKTSSNIETKTDEEEHRNDSEENEDSEDFSRFSVLIKNSSFSLNFFKFLFNLFKVYNFVKKIILKAELKQDLNFVS